MNGVFAARSMMSLYGNFRYPHIDECVSGDLIPRSTKSSIETKLKVYPNPATDEINIVVKMDESEIGELEVMDLQGNILEKYGVDKDKNSYIVNTKSFVSGIYLVKYKSNTGIQKVVKLMIVR
jgi:hypothetical protein